MLITSFSYYIIAWDQFRKKRDGKEVKQDLGRIETGSRVAIVGGGPSGSFFALYLLKYARERGIHPEITIYEPRNFAKPGPSGCKGCAGILSMSLSVIWMTLALHCRKR